MMAFWIKLCVVGIPIFYNFTDAEYSQLLRAAIVKENTVTLFYFVSYKISCLVISYPIPMSGLIFTFLLNIQEKTHPVRILRASIFLPFYFQFC